MWHTYLPRPVEALVFDTLQWVVIRGSTNDLYGRKILRTCCNIYTMYYKRKVFSIQNATSSVLLAFFFFFFLQEKEGWAAERSHSETNVVLARHPRGLSARLRYLLVSEVFPFT